MATFEFDLSQFYKALERAPDAIDSGAKSALKDIKNDWKRGAIDDAPIDSGNLRRQIQAEVVDGGADGYVEITANATRESGGKWKRFNYAYYIHEDKGRVKTGEKKFLDKTAEQRQGEWQKWLEDDISEELKKAGWR